MFQKKLLKFTPILLLITFLSISSFAQTIDSPIDTAGHKTMKILFQQLPIDPTTQVFTIDEIFTYEQENNILKAALLEVLNAKINNLHLVIERSHAESYLINEYLKHNDETIFKYFPRNDYEFYGNNLAELKRIYEQSSHKFEIVGIDITGKDFRAVSLLAILQLFDRYQKQNLELLSEEFFNLYLLAPKWNSLGIKKKMRKIVETISEKMDKGHDYSNEKKFFGKDWKNIEKIIEDYDLGLKYRDKKFEKRRGILYSRLTKLFKEQPTTKFLVHLTKWHMSSLIKCPCKVQKVPFVVQLRKEGIKLMAIKTIHNYQTWYYPYDEFNWEGQEAELITKFGKSKVLDKVKEVSFDGKNHLIDTKGTITAEMFDYLLVLNTILNYTSIVEE